MLITQRLIQVINNAYNKTTIQQAEKSLKFLKLYKQKHTLQYFDHLQIIIFNNKFTLQERQFACKLAGDSITTLIDQQIEKDPEISFLWQRLSDDFQSQFKNKALKIYYNQTNESIQNLQNIHKIITSITIVQIQNNQEYKTLKTLIQTVLDQNEVKNFYNYINQLIKVKYGMYLVPYQKELSELSKKHIYGKELLKARQNIDMWKLFCYYFIDTYNCYGNMHVPDEQEAQYEKDFVIDIGTQLIPYMIKLIQQILQLQFETNSKIKQNQNNFSQQKNQQLIEDIIFLIQQYTQIDTKDKIRCLITKMYNQKITSKNIIQNQTAYFLLPIIFRTSKINQAQTILQQNYSLLHQLLTQNDIKSLNYILLALQLSSFYKSTIYLKIKQSNQFIKLIFKIMQQNLQLRLAKKCLLIIRNITFQIPKQKSFNHQQLNSILQEFLQFYKNNVDKISLLKEKLNFSQLIGNILKYSNSKEKAEELMEFSICVYLSIRQKQDIKTEQKEYLGQLTTIISRTIDTIKQSSKYQTLVNIVQFLLIFCSQQFNPQIQGDYYSKEEIQNFFFIMTLACRYYKQLFKPFIKRLWKFITKYLVTSQFSIFQSANLCILQFIKSLLPLQVDLEQTIQMLMTYYDSLQFKDHKKKIVILNILSVFYLQNHLYTILNSQDNSNQVEQKINQQDKMIISNSFHKALQEKIFQIINHFMNIITNNQSQIDYKIKQEGDKNIIKEIRQSVLESIQTLLTCNMNKNIKSPLLLQNVDKIINFIIKTCSYQSNPQLNYAIKSINLVVQITGLYTEYCNLRKFLKQQISQQLVDTITQNIKKAEFILNNQQINSILLKLKYSPKSEQIKQLLTIIDLKKQLISQLKQTTGLINQRMQNPDQVVVITVNKSNKSTTITQSIKKTIIKDGSALVKAQSKNIIELETFIQVKKNMQQLNKNKKSNKKSNCQNKRVIKISKKT